jgi:hypothetical protein
MREKQTDDEGLERASDEELFAILRRTEKEEDIPALTTRQIDEIGGFGYSNQQLNDRLGELHEDGILGHMKASNRHIWWLSSEGTTQEVEIPELEELIRPDEIGATRFDQKKAEEIAKHCIPNYERNWWRRVFENGQDLAQFSGILIFLALASVLVDISYIPNMVTIVAGITGLWLGLLALIQTVVGTVGGKLSQYTQISEEPFGGENLFKYIYLKIRDIRSDLLSIL